LRLRVLALIRPPRALKSVLAKHFPAAKGSSASYAATDNSIGERGELSKRSVPICTSRLPGPDWLPRL